MKSHSLGDGAWGMQLWLPTSRYRGKIVAIIHRLLFCLGRLIHKCGFTPETSRGRSALDLVVPGIELTYDASNSLRLCIALNSLGFCQQSIVVGLVGICTHMPAGFCWRKLWQAHQHTCIHIKACRVSPWQNFAHRIHQHQTVSWNDMRTAGHHGLQPHTSQHDW